MVSLFELQAFMHGSTRSRSVSRLSVSICAAGGINYTHAQARCTVLCAPLYAHSALHPQRSTGCCCVVWSRVVTIDVPSISVGGEGILKLYMLC
jgi:hypothetical protein